MERQTGHFPRLSHRIRCLGARQMHNSDAPQLRQLRQRCAAAFAARRERVAAICGQQAAADRSAASTSDSGGNEYADMYGFSWMPPLEQFLQPDAAAEGDEHAAASYNQTLAHDRNLYNPAAVELMSQMYHIDPYASIVHAREDLGDWDFASIRTQQDTAWASEQVKKGVALAKERKYEGAIKYYSRALSIVPGHVDALVARGAAYANAGSYQRAIQDFEQALIEDPNCTNAAEYLAATKRKLGFTASARPLTPQKELLRPPTEAVAMQQKSSSERKSEQAELSATERLRRLIEEDEMRRKQKKDKDRSRRSEDGASEGSGSHKKKKKKKEKERRRSKKHKKKKHRRSRSGSHSDSSSGDDSSDDDDDDDQKQQEELHPILQRQRHRLWG